MFKSIIQSGNQKFEERVNRMLDDGYLFVPGTLRIIRYKTQPDLCEVVLAKTNHQDQMKFRLIVESNSEKFAARLNALAEKGYMLSNGVSYANENVFATFVFLPPKKFERQGMKIER